MASIEFPLSFTRQYSGPLDTTAVFASLTDLNDYVANNPIAYAGQIVSVAADGTLYIIMDDPVNPGTLILNAVADQEGLALKADKSTVGDLTNLVVAFTGTARDNLVAAVNKNNGDIGSTASRSITNASNITTLNAAVGDSQYGANSVDSKVAAHAALTDNPHSVTATQVDAYTKTETDSLLDDKPDSAYDNIVQLTQAAYNALGVWPSTTLYIIVG